MTPPTRIIPWPGSSPVPQFNRALVPIGPGQLAHAFDVLIELQPSNRERYANPERTSQVSIYAMPVAIKVTLARLRERVIGIPKPSFNVTLACCASNGIAALAKDPNIRELTALRTRLNMLDEVDASDLEEVMSWFDKYNIALPECDHKQTNVYPPDWLKMSVAGLAVELGVSEWTLFLLAVMTTLITQNKTLEEHRETMRKTVNKFHRRISFRKEIGHALLKIIDPDSPKETQSTQIDD